MKRYLVTMLIDAYVEAEDETQAEELFQNDFGSYEVDVIDVRAKEVKRSGVTAHE